MDSQVDTSSPPAALERSAPLPAVGAMTADNPEATKRTKWCERCNEVHPIESFRIATSVQTRNGVTKRYKSRHRICKRCMDKRRGKNKVKNNKAVNSKLQAMLAKAANSKTIDVAHISEVAAALTAKAGGVDRATSLWWAQIELAMELEPGKRDTIKNFEGWANLILKSTENRQTAPDVTGMTTDDIQRELRRLALEQGDNLERLHGDN